MKRLSNPGNARLICLLPLGFLLGCAISSARNRQALPVVTADETPYLQESSDAVQVLQKWYLPATGLYETTGWWNSANAITVLVDYSRVSGSTDYKSVLANTFREAQRSNPGFLNKFYDDEGWWALAWIDAYDLTQNTEYLTMARSIFADMSGGWDETCGGGIWWSKEKNYKNAIANELFLSIAAHLANRSSGSTRRQYLAWGNKEWRWFQATGMINAQGLINDGLEQGPMQGSERKCTNNGKTAWTYNQGVVLGGLAELSKANHDPLLIGLANKVASAAITKLADQNGVLHESCEPKCGTDGVQFKGIFVRNLAQLNMSQPNATIERFIDKNADSIWTSARGPQFQLDERWSGPFDSSNASSQTSALDVLVGAATIHRSMVEKRSRR